MLLGIETMILVSMASSRSRRPERRQGRGCREKELGPKEAIRTCKFRWMEEMSAGFFHGFSHTKPVVNKYRQDFLDEKWPQQNNKKKHTLFVV